MLAKYEHHITHHWFLFFVVFVGFFLNLGGVPLFDLDEGAFTEATREMLASGHFSATYLDGKPRYDKPILTYWFQALSVSLFGLNEFAVRLPSAVAASLWLFSGYMFAKQQWRETTARYFVLFMSVTLWISIIGRAAIADAWLNLFICLTMFDMWRYRETPALSRLIRVYLWMGFGMLTKGPVAILIPLLTGLIHFALNGQFRLFLRAIFHPAGWATLIAVVSPWLYLVYLEQGAGFFHGFIFEHNLNRFNRTKENHGGQLHYYLLILPIILLPLSGLLFSAIKHIRTLWQQELNQFLLIWFAVVFGLVSFSQTQLPHYVLYGVTGLVLVMAAERHTLTSYKHIWAPLTFFVFLLLLPSLLSFAVSDKASYDQAVLKEYPKYFNQHYYFACGLLVVASIYISFFSQLNNINKLILNGVAQTIFVVTVFVEAFAGMQQVPVHQAALFTKNSDKNVVAYQIKMPSFSVYRDAITPKTTPRIGDRVFTKIDRVDELQKELKNAKLNQVFRQGGIVLVDIEPSSFAANVDDEPEASSYAEHN